MYDALLDELDDDASSRTEEVIEDLSEEAVAAFDRAEAEALAVVHSSDSPQVIGLLSEAYALRRYSEQLELRRQELAGD